MPLNEAQERALVDETVGQMTRALEARELEAQLLQSARLVSLGEMAAGVAHELNQPLTVISTTASGICYRLLNGPDLSPEQLQKRLQRVLSVVSRLDRTIDHFGVGIPDDDLERLFEPFFTTKDADRGTGLGLSISYAIVKNHGGEIFAYSAPGERTAFKVVLPVGKQSAGDE